MSRLRFESASCGSEHFIMAHSRRLGKMRAVGAKGTHLARSTAEVVMADEFEEMKPNQAAWKEKAEGSRENVNLDTGVNHPNLGTGAESPMERGSGQVSQPDKPINPQPAGRPERENAGGITNRPLSEEQNEEEQLPPRGDTKHGGHAS